MNIKHLAVVLPALTFAATADAAIGDGINSYDILEAASFQQPNLTGIANLPKPSVDLVLGNTNQTVHAFIGPTPAAVKTGPSNELKPSYESH